MRKVTRKGLNAFFEDGQTKVVLYNTVILRLDGKHITLNSGGWLTKHTKNCMNDWLNRAGYRVFQRKGQWFVSAIGADKNFEFKDGMKIDYTKNEEVA